MAGEALVTCPLAHEQARQRQWNSRDLRDARTRLLRVTVRAEHGYLAVAGRTAHDVDQGLAQGHGDDRRGTTAEAIDGRFAPTSAHRRQTPRPAGHSRRARCTRCSATCSGADAHHGRCRRSSTTSTSTACARLGRWVTPVRSSAGPRPSSTARDACGVCVSACRGRTARIAGPTRPRSARRSASAVATRRRRCASSPPASRSTRSRESESLLEVVVRSATRGAPSPVATMRSMRVLRHLQGAPEQRRYTDDPPRRSTTGTASWSRATTPARTTCRWRRRCAPSRAASNSSTAGACPGTSTPPQSRRARTASSRWR